MSDELPCVCGSERLQCIMESVFTMSHKYLRYSALEVILPVLVKMACITWGSLEVNINPHSHPWPHSTGDAEVLLQLVMIISSNCLTSAGARPN